MESDEKLTAELQAMLGTASREVKDEMWHFIEGMCEERKGPVTMQDIVDAAREYLRTADLIDRTYTRTSTRPESLEGVTDEKPSYKIVMDKDGARMETQQRAHAKKGEGSWSRMRN